MKKLLYCLMSLLIILTLTSCDSKKETTVKSEEFVIEDNNLKLDGDSISNDTFYEIFVGAFSDSNKDGIGDLRGVINRLDYLNDGNPNSGKSLGVTGIWLMPIFKSSSYHKYDVTDYYEVDSTYGTKDDLKELITKCHERGIKLILDMPINHTSTSNEWFLNFKSALKNENLTDQYANYYVYCSNSESLNGRTTTNLSGTNYKYECNFDSSMPELNYDNDLVREEVLNIAKYYIDLGIDGFRFDAAKYIYYESKEKTIDFWTWYMSELKKLKSDIYCVGEVWDSQGIITDYYSAMTCFDFSFSQAEGYITTAAKGGSFSSYFSQISNYYNSLKEKNANYVCAPFIANHDTDRAAGYLTLASGNAYSAANLLLMSKGTPFIYYGEEIGLLGSRGGSNTDANRRLKMLWGDDDTVKDPVGATFSIDKQKNGTVIEHKKDSSSLYNHYKKLIMMRNRNPEISKGEYQEIKITSEKYVGGFIATYNNSSCLVIFNNGNNLETIDLTNYSEYKVLNSYAGKSNATLQNNKLTIGEKTVVILRND